MLLNLVICVVNLVVKVYFILGVMVIKIVLGWGIDNIIY